MRTFGPFLVSIMCIEKEKGGLKFFFFNVRKNGDLHQGFRRVEGIR